MRVGLPDFCLVVDRRGGEAVPLGLQELAFSPDEVQVRGDDEVAVFVGGDSSKT